MRPVTPRSLQLLASTLSVLLLIIVAAGAWGYFHIRASLPQLDGVAALPGLHSSVTVTRDALGVPIVRGETRADVARALGFLHAQDRFFQMDLLRRRASGELAALFGANALPLDHKTRPHGFRAFAQAVLAALPAEDRALLEAYAAGVNTGREALNARPFEYFVLRTNPQPWLPEDSILAIYAMALDLQDADNTYERSLMTLRDVWGTAAVNFFAPLASPDDAALDGSTAPLPPIPSEDVIDPRKKFAASRTPDAIDQRFSADATYPGSNSFALSGEHITSGAALLANDPHLNLGLPNVWYRVVLEWNDPDGSMRVTGVSIPGLPFVAIGSNGHIAWSLTAAYVDTADLIPVDVSSHAPTLYRAPTDPALRELEFRREVIVVKGAPAETIETPWTHWGPIVGRDADSRPLVLRWTMHDPSAINLEFSKLENARDVREGLAIAQRAGMPATNVIIADHAGDIGWTLAGALPKRVGFDGRLPVSWTFGDRRWNGFLKAEEKPLIVSPPDGRLWSANQRPLGGEWLTRLGDGDFAAPPRAAQIRDQLAQMKNAAPRDFLAVQLDNRALFLERWQKLALRVLTSEAVANDETRAGFRELVANWNARASVDSVGYRLVSAFRTSVADLVLTPVFQRCLERMPRFDWTRFHYEPALWAILKERPAHFLPASHTSWDALLLTAVDRTIERIEAESGSLARATWGRHNRARIRHPFSHVLPSFLAQRLNLPEDPLPGDAHMPLIQEPDFGASMRLVVAPGREAEGIFHMPGGQSGHPLSPFYRAGHDAWVRGEPTPLLPGETRHTLSLEP